MPRQHRVGVLGAGVIGVGVAHGAAQAGHDVVVVDLTQEILDRARGRLLESLRLQKLLGGRPSSDPAELLARITLTTDEAALATATFVVECISESAELKQAAFRRLDDLCPPETVFASATSAIPITRIGSWTRRPDRVVGIHFMNPVPLKAMCELIPGFHTSAGTLETARDLLAGLGKSAVQVGDSPGFVSNRVLMLTINEAVFLVHEGVASADEVDRIFKGCFGHKMGPLETADMIGLDTVLASIEVLQEAFRDDKYRPCPLLRKMVDAGLLGRKSGRGFHAYPAG